MTTRPQHSPEPWQTDGRLIVYVLPSETVAERSRILIATAEGNSDEARRNARRIVACVNACAGLSEADLLNSGLSRRIQELATENAQLREALADYARAALAQSLDVERSHK